VISIFILRHKQTGVKYGGTSSNPEKYWKALCGRKGRIAGINREIVDPENNFEMEIAAQVQEWDAEPVLRFYKRLHHLRPLKVWAKKSAETRAKIGRGVIESRQLRLGL